MLFTSSFTLFSFQGSFFQLLLQPDLKICLYARSSDPTTNCCLVGPSGLEPPTLRLSVVRSSQLSYGPIVDTSSISLAAPQAVRLVHFAASPLPRRPPSLGSARILDVWLFLLGGDSRDRTGDLLLARQALSQLSYIPAIFFPQPSSPAPSKLNNEPSSAP